MFHYLPFYLFMAASSHSGRRFCMPMNILALCPAGVTTGGTESIHNLVREFDRIEGVNARILYKGQDLSNPMPAAYAEYGCRYVTDLTEDYRGVVIFPEIWANMALDPRYENCIRAVNWLGIDAYAFHTPPGAWGAFLDDPEIIHMAQSEYAVDFLHKLGIWKVYRNVDVLNDIFFEDYGEPMRSSVIAYNPARSNDFTNRLIEKCVKMGMRFQPISGMTREQVAMLLRASKLYIDFGDFPGRDRIPREAVMCGCCIITSTTGSARFDEDFPIQSRYKYDCKDGHIFAIVRTMKSILENYEIHRKDFDHFRTIISMDSRMLTAQCMRFVNEIQHNHPGA